MIETDSNVSSKSTKRRTEAMQKCLHSFSLKTILRNDEPTFHHNNQISSSQIDHIYFFIPETSNSNVQLKTHLCLKDDSSNISSHDVIVGELILPVTQDNITIEDYTSTYCEETKMGRSWKRRIQTSN